MQEDQWLLLESMIFSLWSLAYVIFYIRALWIEWIAFQNDDPVRYHPPGMSVKSGWTWLRTGITVTTLPHAARYPPTTGTTVPVMASINQVALRTPASPTTRSRRHDFSFFGRRIGLLASLICLVASADPQGSMKWLVEPAWMILGTVIHVLYMGMFSIFLWYLCDSVGRLLSPPTLVSFRTLCLLWITPLVFVTLSVGLHLTAHYLDQLRYRSLYFLALATGWLGYHLATCIVYRTLRLHVRAVFYERRRHMIQMLTTTSSLPHTGRTDSVPSHNNDTRDTKDMKDVREERESTEGREARDDVRRLSPTELRALSPFSSGNVRKLTERLPRIPTGLPQRAVPDYMPTFHPNIPTVHHSNQEQRLHIDTSPSPLITDRRTIQMITPSNPPDAVRSNHAADAVIDNNSPGHHASTTPTPTLTPTRISPTHSTLALNVSGIRRAMARMKWFLCWVVPCGLALSTLCGLYGGQMLYAQWNDSLPPAPRTAIEALPFVVFHVVHWCMMGGVVWYCTPVSPHTSQLGPSTATPTPDPQISTLYPRRGATVRGAGGIGTGSGEYDPDCVVLASEPIEPIPEVPSRCSSGTPVGVSSAAHPIQPSSGATVPVLPPVQPFLPISNSAIHGLSDLSVLSKSSAAAAVATAPALVTRVPPVAAHPSSALSPYDSLPSSLFKQLSNVPYTNHPPFSQELSYPV